MRPAACLLPALLCLPLAALLVPHAAAQTEELGSNIDQARASRFGDIDEVTAIPQNVTPPSKPTGFRAKAGNRRVILSWNNPGNSAITGWQVQQKEGNNAYGSWTAISGSGASTVSHTVSGLSNGTVYAFRIRAVKETVNGPQSDEATATPLATPAKPAGFSATAGRGAVSLSWSDPGNSDISGWQYQQKEGNNAYGSWTAISGSDASTTSHTVTGLSNGTAYTFRIRAVAGTVNGAPSDEATATPEEAPNVFWYNAGGQISIVESVGTHNAPIWVARDLVSALTVNYSLSGTATCGADYMITGADCTAGTGAFTLPANTTAFTDVLLPITITADDISDNGETIIVTLTAGDGYNLGAGPVLTFDIYEDTGTAAFSLSGIPQVGETLTIVKDSDDPDGNGLFLYLWQFRAMSSDSWDLTLVGLAARNRDCLVESTTCTPTHNEDYPTVGGYFRGFVGYTDGNGLGTTLYTNAVGPFTLPPPGIVLPTADLALREGATASYNLKLATDPGDGATVRVSVTSGDTGAVTVNDTQSGEDGVQNHLDFTGGSGGSWNTHQAVAVRGVQDADATSEADVALIHAVSVQAGASAPYTGLADRILNVDVRDDDAPNSAPAFASGTLTRSVAENAAAGANVGAAIPAATDRDGDALTYTLGGADADSFQGVTARMTVRVADIDPDAVRGWHVRWGRTLSQQVVDALQDRFAAVPTPPGLHLRVAGEELTSAVPLAENRQVLSKALGFEDLSAQQVVAGSAFSFSPVGAEAARFALWGRGALSSFSGQEDTVSLEGEVSTALVGAERWQAGAALSRSWGSGSYGGAHRGEVDTSGMTGLFPYGRYALTPRLGIWAVAGWGWGQLSLQPDGTAGEYQPWSKLSMTAVGLDGLLLDGGAEGLSLVSTAEVLRVRTVSEEVADLAGSEGIISRRRLELEATRAFPLSNGAALSPSLSLAVREDGGDGETGFGLEMGAGLLWADPARGVRGELQGRSLLSHVEEEFREQGLSLSFAWDPAPGNRGPSLSLSHAVGATAAGGMDALLQPVAIQVLDDAHGGQQQFAAELAYGVSAFADRFTLSPGVGLVLSPDGAVYSLGWALAPYAQQAQAEPWELALQGEREQRSATTSADHSLTLRFSLLF